MPATPSDARRRGYIVPIGGAENKSKASKPVILLALTQREDVLRRVHAFIDDGVSDG